MTAAPERPAAMHAQVLPSLLPTDHVDRALLDRLARRVCTAGPGRTPMTSYAPFTLEPVGTVPTCTAEDVAEAARRARAAQRDWAARPLAERVLPFVRFAELVMARQDTVLDLVQVENGKARAHAFEEVADVALTARYYAANAERHLRPRRRMGAFPVLTTATELHHPRGVVGVIAPWNYPLTLAVGDALPALLAGNGVVLKPDSLTAFTALWAVDLLVEAGLPEGLFQVVTGDGPTIGPPLVGAADYLCFTGSTRTGRLIAAQCGERLIGCSLELGGKNPLLVLADADLRRTTRGAVRACFSSAGQLCISAERLYVHESVYGEFVRRFVGRVEAMRLSGALDFRADMGSLVSDAQLATVTAHVSDAVSKGARVLTGGKARPDLGPYFHEPTVLAGVTPDMRVHDEETFGPVVSLYSFRTEDEAIARANATSYGLNASVWTRDVARGSRVAARIEAGTVNVNEGYAAAWSSLDAPMGGMKDSGLGRRHGREGIVKYTETQTVAAQRLLGFDAPFGMGNAAYARFLGGLVRVVKHLPRR